VVCGAVAYQGARTGAGRVRHSLGMLSYGRQYASSVETLFVRHHLAMLDVPPEKPQVHRPAVAGHPVVIVVQGRAHVVEACLCPAVRNFNRLRLLRKNFCKRSRF
jgi:hypothetical protein